METFAAGLEATMTTAMRITHAGTIISTFALALVVLSSCDTITQDEETLDPLTAGVRIYESYDFGGVSLQLTGDVADLKDYGESCDGETDSLFANWDDCVSSIRVAPGWKAVMYEDDDFKGDSLEVKSDVHDLGDYHMDNKVTSIQVRRQ